MKYQIKKNSVQETLIIPVYGRKMCSMLFPNLFRDETAIQLIGEYQYTNIHRKNASIIHEQAEQNKTSVKRLAMSLFHRGFVLFSRQSITEAFLPIYLSAFLFATSAIFIARTFNGRPNSVMNPSASWWS